MKNFKQIAEDCLTGKLSGTFVLRDGSEIKSKYLKRLPSNTSIICSYGLYGLYISDNGYAYGNTGYLHESSIERFIPDTDKEQIIIDIPEGMSTIREENPGEIRIKFVKEKLTYDDIYDSLYDDELEIQDNYCSSYSNDVTMNFHKKVEVLRKLTNIRNYFGKPKNTENGFYINMLHEVAPSSYPSMYASNIVAFAKKEHAEEAIRILGDELKYLFEPW